ncbi:MAG: mechanosensitive ion channel [Clostridia bacterium]|nr:mechanosensitive ion channel [Clostridia bacterium]
MYFNLLDETSMESVEETLTMAQKWLEQASNWLWGILPNVISAIIIFIAGWWLSKVICKIFVKAMKKGKADLTVISFLASIINTVLKLLVIICVLSTIGVDVTTLIAAIGAATVTVGLALKDSLANVASGTLIILNKKFKTGDYIETEGLQGEVVKIEMMYTTLRTYDNKEIMIPNSKLTSNNVTNYFVREQRRVDLVIPIGYNEDVEEARKVIMRVIHTDSRVIQEQNNKVMVQQLGESSVDLCVWIWCRSEDYWTVRADMQEKIKSELDRHNITIPFNQLDVHLIDEKISK